MTIRARRWGKLAATAGLLGLAVAALPLHTAANVGGLTVAPEHNDPSNPLTRSYVISQVGPGNAVSDQLRVSNTSSSTLSLIASPVDGLTAVTSGAVYANNGDAVRRWGGWLTLGMTSFTVAPNSSVLLPFTVTVPLDASPGDHLAGIAVEDAQPATTGTNLQVTTVYRVVTGVLVQVPGPAAFDLKVTDAWLAGPGSPQQALVLPLSDTGLLLGKPNLSVAVMAADGSNRQAITQSLDTLLPGDPIDYAIAWPYSLPSNPCIAVSAVGPGMSAPTTFFKGCPVGTPPPPVPPTGPQQPGHPANSAPQPTPAPTPAASAPPDPGSAAVAGGSGRGGGRPGAAGKPGAGGAGASAGAGFPLRAVLAKLLPAVVGGVTLPLLLFVILAIFLAVQDRLDRGDPKLALAPVHADPDLPFLPPSHWRVAQ